jgi:hypothetical protein
MSTKENQADFTVKGNISLYIIIGLISALISFGTIIANTMSLEKRITQIESREEISCGKVNDILIINGRIEQQLIHIKESLKDHIAGEKK